MFLAINWFNTTVITLLGFAIVFVVLVLLIFILTGFGAIMQPKVKAETPVKTEAGHDHPTETQIEDVKLTANTTAAIAMALHLYYAQQHDEEPMEIHITHITRNDSPWNSKAFGMNNLHRS